MRLENEPRIIRTDFCDSICAVSCLFVGDCKFAVPFICLQRYHTSSPDVFHPVTSPRFIVVFLGWFSSKCSASLIPPPTPASSTPAKPSAEDIRKVVAQYQARESAKSKSAAGKDKGDGSGSKGQDKEKEKGKESPKSPASPAPASTPTPAPTPTHRKFALHRAIFDMRRNELKRREMGVKAREVGRGKPSLFRQCRV